MKNEFLAAAYTKARLPSLLTLEINRENRFDVAFIP